MKRRFLLLLVLLAGCVVSASLNLSPEPGTPPENPPMPVLPPPR